MYATQTRPLQITRESAIKRKIFKATVVTPKEYCDKWVTLITGIQPDEGGYYMACVREIARVTYLAEQTIQNWGKDFVKSPKHGAVHAALEGADRNNALKVLLGFKPDQEP